MANRGGQPGNTNAGRGSDWRDAIRHVAAKRGKDVEGSDPAYIKGLRKVAEKFFEAAENGDPWAMKELGDRVDGKAVQAIDVEGQLDIPMSGTVKIVKSGDE